MGDRGPPVIDLRACNLTDMDLRERSRASHDLLDGCARGLRLRYFRGAFLGLSDTDECRAEHQHRGHGDLRLLGHAIPLDLGFGLDSSLVAQRGWDDATGYGVPNGLLFIEAVRQFARRSR